MLMCCCVQVWRSGRKRIAQFTCCDIQVSSGVNKISRWPPPRRLSVGTKYLVMSRLCVHVTENIALKTTGGAGRVVPIVWRGARGSKSYIAAGGKEVSGPWLLPLCVTSFMTNIIHCIHEILDIHIQ